MSVNPAAIAALKSRIGELQKMMLSGLVARETPMRLALLAALAGEHVLLLGPPGTAKSEVARRLHLAFTGTSYFERLVTRFSVPEELFGPLSLKALEQDRYERLVTGYLPAAGVAFIDEIFKANSAILNSLLTLLNEREFDNGTVRLKTPLITAIGASNELPDGPELGALFDRFLVRYEVTPVGDDQFRAMLESKTVAPSVPTEMRLSREDVQAIAISQAAMPIAQEVFDLLAAARTFMTQQNVYVSDRRWKKILKLLRTAALTDGRDSVETWDCWVLEHCLWNKPEEREAIEKWYRSRIGAADAAEPDRLSTLISKTMEVIDREAGKTEQSVDSNGLPLWNGQDGKPTTTRYVQARRGNELLWNNPVATAGPLTQGELQQVAYRQYGVDVNAYVRDPKNAHRVELTPCVGRARYSKHHILGRAREARDLLHEALMQLDQLDRRGKGLQEMLAGSIWLTESFAKTVTRAFEKQVKRLKLPTQTAMRAFVTAATLPCSDGILPGPMAIFDSLPTPEGTPPLAAELHGHLAAAFQRMQASPQSA